MAAQNDDGHSMFIFIHKPRTKIRRTNILYGKGEGEGRGGEGEGDSYSGVARYVCVGM